MSEELTRDEQQAREACTAALRKLRTRAERHDALRAVIADMVLEDIVAGDNEGRPLGIDPGAFS